MKPKAYCIPKASITAYPALDEAGADAATRAVLQGDFTLNGTDVFNTIDLLYEKCSGPSAEPQGRPENASVLNKATLVTAVTEEEAVDFQRQAVRDDMLWIIPLKTGKFVVLGNEDFKTITKVTINNGSDVSSDDKEMTIEIEVTDIALPFYNGSIMTADGDQNAPFV